MSLIKRIGKSEAVRGALCWLGSLYIRLVYLTGRWEVMGDDTARAKWAAGEPFILAFWHGRILLMPYSWDRSKQIHMLISHHRDGQIIAKTVSWFGIKTVAGSTSKGGSAALRQMLKALKNGEWVGITPDGPRGPRMRASDGVAAVAKMSGVPVIPATFASKSAKTLGSWDRFQLAKPFSRGVFVWGKPISVDRAATDEDLNRARQAIEDELNRITAMADDHLGRETIEPAAPETEDLTSNEAAP